MKIFLYSSLCLLLTLAICLLASLSRVLAQEEVANKAIVTQHSNLLQNIQQIATGDNHTCALTTAGGVKCWGNNSSSQLGTGNTLANNVAVDVIDLSHGITAITAGGFHTCALTSANTVLCWGVNVTGSILEAVSGANGAIVAISAGGFHTCALTSAGGVKCWGSNHIVCWGNNSNGQLGNGTNHNSSIAVPVSGLSSGVSAISAGNHHTCALTTMGAVWCWGRNYVGQLGNDSVLASNVPSEVRGLPTEVSAISASSGLTCVLTAAGDALCWGDNSFGQLGDDNAWKRTPVDVLVTLPVHLPIISR